MHLQHQRSRGCPKPQPNQLSFAPLYRVQLGEPSHTLAWGGEHHYNLQLSPILEAARSGSRCPLLREQQQWDGHDLAWPKLFALEHSTCIWFGIVEIFKDASFWFGIGGKSSLSTSLLPFPSPTPFGKLTLGSPPHQGVCELHAHLRKALSLSRRHSQATYHTGQRSGPAKAAFP